MSTACGGCGSGGAADAYALMMTEADKNGDGTVTVDEMANYLAQILGEDPAQVKQALEAADINHDGKITTEEFTKFVSSLGGKTPEEAKQMTADADKNGDGIITAEELKAYLETHHKNV